MGQPVDLETLRAALDTRAARPSSDYDLNPGVQLPEGRRLRAAAVLIPVLGSEVILTKRASHLKHHPGQIALPGGKVDGTDDGAAAAALREAREEIGLDPSNVALIAELPAHETVTGYTITPILARVRAEFAAVPEEGEVAEVFRVPLAFLMDPSNYRVEGRLWRGTRRNYYVAPYGPYYIWGATARILKSLADRLGP
ncbi:CoA pyrophosphatase [Roseibacterium sp. SDUM158017]|uniref:CoA pyrophosphatase n=1 Tax=Roseicyclus salinarum TaxID=3036773 RepID=UPI00241589AE|nr:CoA pyrophosphatase [Roseibacterium sp. SDUM158017]MDG4646871.1 CoA pyrophosphatase [Roseibacterium sp. SDUM158017]